MQQSNKEFIENFRARKDPVVWDIPSSSHGQRKYCGVYLAHHLQSGKLYVGSSGDLYRRKGKHLSLLRLNKHWQTPFQSKYNESQELNWAYLLTATEEEAIQLEQEILTHYLPQGCLFNVSGDATKTWTGLRHTEDTKRLIREKVHERMQDPEYAKKLSLANVGKVLSEEHKRKISDFNRGKVNSEETKEKMRQASLGKAKSPEHAAKIRERLIRERGRRVSIDGVIYDSLGSAARALGIHPGVMPNRMLNKTGKYDGWCYV